MPWVPFLLEGVGGEPDLNLPDGIHPNVDGHRRVAENVLPVLRRRLEEELGDRLGKGRGAGLSPRPPAP